MKLLFVLEYFYPHVGGAETLFNNLTARLAAKGHDVTVYTSLVDGAKREERWKGVRVVRQPVLNRYDFAFRGFAEAARLAKDADLVHTTAFVASGTTWLSNMIRKKPTVATFHEVWRGLFFEVQPLHKAIPNWIFETLMCMFYRGEKITCPSEYTKKSLVKAGIPEKNITVIQHGIDFKLFNPRAKPSLKFPHKTYLFHGRPGVSKGVPYLLGAVEKIHNETGAKLLMMVSKSQRAEYKNLVAAIDRLGIKDKIILLESQRTEKVPGIIRSADVVCIPSLSEGFGFSAVEAQACGIPVVASRAGSLPEVVKGGVLVEPRSSEAIANAVIDLLNDKKKRKALGRRGANFVRRFSWDRALPQYEKLYERVLRSA